MVQTLFLFFLVAGPLPFAADAWYPRLEEHSILDEVNPAPLVGSNRRYLLAPGDTLIEMARRSGTGYQAMIQANPGIDPWLPPAGKEIELPYAFILPLETGKGITINLAECRLYLVWREKDVRKVRAYPIGIGREGTDTPTGNFVIVSKVRNPTWFPPAEIRKKTPGMPSSVPPGPNNPLGEHWLGLSIDGYGIHGTTKTFGIGRRVSHGCLRLYPEDIRDLSRKVHTGTPVSIIHQPIKVGLNNQELYLEVHPALSESMEDALAELWRQIASLPWQGRLNMTEVHKVIREQRGIPILISHP